MMNIEKIMTNFHALKITVNGLPVFLNDALSLKNNNIFPPNNAIADLNFDINFKLLRF